jgi:uncharacterized RDD family membrane protein YckC
VPPAATPDPGGSGSPGSPGSPGAGVARGQRLGLPIEGPGSIAPTGRRLGAFIVDAIAASLVAALFTASVAGHRGTDALPGSWSLIPLALDYLVGLPLAGRTLGMNLFGIRVIAVERANPSARITVMDAAVRTVLLMLLIPALVWDKDGRGLHDRLARTVPVLA